MKRQLVPLLLVALALTAPGCLVVVDGLCPELVGYRVTDYRYTEDFWGVEVYDDLNVILVPGPYTVVEVTADPGAQPYVKTQVAPDGVLEVWWQGPACAREGVREVYIEGPELVVLGKHAAPRDTTKALTRTNPRAQ